MVFFNYSTMQMVAKVVYYGPGLCGKTTNLSFIYEKTSPKSRGEMLSLATETDRTLFFDLLPLDVGLIAGFKTKFQLYTVPGQVFYNATRKLVLKGVDGVVFVADSQIPMLDANQESLQNLKDNLEDLGLSIDDIPLVFQYNKRDLPNVTEIDRLNQLLNSDGQPFVEASALYGDGVFETLKAISKMTLLKLKAKVLGDELKKSASGTVKFNVQGAESIKKEIQGHGPDDTDNTLDRTEVRENPNASAEAAAGDSGAMKVEESLPGLAAVSFDDYQAPADDEDEGDEISLGETSFPSINFDTIDLDELEEEIETVEGSDLEALLPDHEAEIEEWSGEDFDDTAPMQASEDAPTQAGTSEPPAPPPRKPVEPAAAPVERPAKEPASKKAIPEAPPAPKPVKKKKSAASPSPLDSLEAITSSLKKSSSGIKTKSVDDLLSVVVPEPKAPKKKPKPKKIQVKVPCAYQQVHVRCLLADESGKVVHSHTVRLEPEVDENGNKVVSVRFTLDES